MGWWRGTISSATTLWHAPVCQARPWEGGHQLLLQLRAGLPQLLHLPHQTSVGGGEAKGEHS